MHGFFFFTEEQDECLEDDEHEPDSGGLMRKSRHAAAEDQGGVAQGPENKTLQELALKMREAGDQMVQDYGYGERATVRVLTL